MRKGIIELNRLHYAKEIVKFVKRSNRAPLGNTIRADISDGERLLGCKLRSLRDVYRQNGLSDDIVEVFKDNGMDMTILANDIESKGMLNLLGIYRFRVDNGRYPALRSLDIEERRLAVVHNNMKAANKGKHPMVIYPSYLKLISSLGMRDFFDVGVGGSKAQRKTWVRSSDNFERTDMDIIRDVCEFMGKYGKKPSKNSSVDYESRLAYRFRRLYRKHRDIGLSSKYIRYATELGYGNLFG